jgi:hypothetical protein
MKSIYKQSQNNLSLVASLFIYLAIVSSLYLIFNYFDFTSPRGFPLKPFNSYYAINDYVFFSTGTKVVDEIIIRPSIIFFYTIKVVDSFFPQGALSIVFNLIGLCYILRLHYVFKYCNLNPFVMWIFIPYLYYFSIFPSSDFLASVFILEIFFLLYKFLNEKTSPDRIIRIIIYMSFFVFLASLTRANAVVLFAIPFFIAFKEFFNSHSTKSHKKNSLLMMLLLSFLGTAFLYYYSGVLKIYISSSTEYLNSIGVLNYGGSLFFKFFYSFGLRESFYTVAGDGFVKNEIYILLRLALGSMLFISFLMVIFLRKMNLAFCNSVLIIYLLLFVSAFSGVSFERYFIAIYPFILQFGFSSLIDRLKK